MRPLAVDHLGRRVNAIRAWKAKMGISKDDTQRCVPKLGYFGGLATKRAADARAQALLSTVHEIQAAGVVRLKDITDELNRRGVPAARGGNRWYRSGVARLLTRLRALERALLVGGR
jgi:hypothetical protein